MRFKNALYILIICSLSSCSKINETHQKLQGNWHSGISELPILPEDIRSEKDYSYSEFVYSDNYMYQYTNNSTFPYALKYTMKQDSLFFHVGAKQQEQFVGILVYPNDSTLHIYSYSDTIVHYKMKKFETSLDKYIYIESIELNPFHDIENYDTYFQSRLHKKLKEFIIKE